MNRPTRPITGLAFALALVACSSAKPSASVRSTTGAKPSATQSPTSQVASVRCSLTPAASRSATVQWNLKVEGSPTIKAGQAVAFITQSNMGPTVTEALTAAEMKATNGTAPAAACIDEALVAKSPLVVTFYRPGSYNIFCRKAPTIMRTVVHVLASN